jgi:hypothetical protein
MLCVGPFFIHLNIFYKMIRNEDSITSGTISPHSLMFYHGKII